MLKTVGHLSGEGVQRMLHGEAERSLQYAKECDERADDIGRMVAAHAERLSLHTAALRSDAWNRAMHDGYRAVSHHYYRHMVRARVDAAKWRARARKLTEWIQ